MKNVLWSNFSLSERRMLQPRPQKSRHLASRKSGPLSSEKLILLSRSRCGGRALAFSKEVFRLGNLWIFFKAREKSSNLRSTRGKSQGKKRNGEEEGGEGKGELRESRKTERRNSRRPGKMRIVCTHEGNYLPPSLFPLPPLVLSLFFPFRKEEKEEEVERERKREEGQNSEFSRTFRRERIAESVARSRFPMKGFFSGILHNRSRFRYS